MTRTDDAGTPGVIARIFGSDQFIKGSTGNLVVTASAQTATLGATVPSVGCIARIANIGTQTVFVRFDGTVPTVSNALPILPNTVELFDLGPGATVQAIAAATGSTLYVTLGYGQ